MSEGLLVVLLGLTVAWIVVRIRRSKTEAKAALQPKLRHTGRFHAVAIMYSENACDAAKAMTGRRFLASAAPKLPLENCNFDQCRCKFANYDDRRSRHDRRSPFSHAGTPGGAGASAMDRRSNKDRRENDDDDPN